MEEDDTAFLCALTLGFLEDENAFGLQPPDALKRGAVPRYAALESLNAIPPATLSLNH
ncbi:MAG: hypothetical protein WB782_03250 [Thermoplasmata archaeon]